MAPPQNTQLRVPRLFHLSRDCPVRYAPEVRLHLSPSPLHPVCLFTTVRSGPQCINFLVPELDSPSPTGFEHLNSHSAADARAKTDIRVLEYHPYLLLRWADAAPGKRWLPASPLMGVKPTTTSSSSGNSSIANVHNIIMCSSCCMYMSLRKGACS
jgi:hypothetical protein